MNEKKQFSSTRLIWVKSKKPPIILVLDDDELNKLTGKGRSHTKKWVLK
jgi:hypothetical protein